MGSASRPAHETPYTTRADQPSAPVLTAYLLRLMAFKRSNLCLSIATSITFAQLSGLLEACGASIVVLKLHSDLIADFRSSIANGIAEIAARKHFLILEDRSFGGDGISAQVQYTKGSPAPASWTQLTTAHLLFGAGIIPALRSAAHSTITAAGSSFQTIITGGAYDDHDDDDDPAGVALSPAAQDSSGSPPHAGRLSTSSPRHSLMDKRKASIVSISTTISSSTEYIVSPTSPSAARRLDLASDDVVPPVPLARGLLLQAHVDAEAVGGSTDAVRGYARRCVGLASAHRGFVIGLSVHADLPGAEAVSKEVRGGLGGTVDAREYLVWAEVASEDEDAPEAGSDGDDTVAAVRHAISNLSADVVVVGKRIVDSDEVGATAEKLRSEAWAAYCKRVGVADGTRV